MSENTLTVIIQQSGRVIREPDWNDSWDRGHTADEYLGCKVYAGSAEGRGRLGSVTYELELPFEVHPGMVVYPVIAVYSTGSTFGTHDGAVQVIGVWDTAEDALTAEKVAREVGNDFGPVSAVGQVFYPNWIGYFEHLTDIYVETEVVRA